MNCYLLNGEVGVGGWDESGVWGMGWLFMVCWIETNSLRYFVVARPGHEV